MKADSETPTSPDNGPKTPAAGRGKGGPVTREDRLKAALKANMARRKAQAKARTGEAHEKSQGQ